MSEWLVEMQHAHTMELIKERDTLRKQLDEELELGIQRQARYRRELDEARGLLASVRRVCTYEYGLEIDAWLEANK